jgi:hypothetical protein
LLKEIKLNTFNSIQELLQKLGLWNFLLTSLEILLLVSFGTLAIVYLFGRFLELAKTDKAKNSIAAFFMLILSILVTNYIQFQNPLYFLTITKLTNWFNYGFTILFYYLFSIIFYIIVCWKFYDNTKKIIDSFINKIKKEKK